ncbi:hypothetical protein SMICM304S_02772 [Streptomyces microflavus]
MIRQVRAVDTADTSHGRARGSHNQCHDGPSSTMAQMPPPCTTSRPRPTAREKPCAFHTRRPVAGVMEAAISSTGRCSLFRSRCFGPRVTSPGAAGSTAVTLHLTTTSASSASRRAARATSAPA